MSEYSKPEITGDGVLSIDSADKVKSKASRRQIEALKGVKVIRGTKSERRMLSSRTVKIDYYRAQDEIEASLNNVTDIIGDAKESDPEFYDELKTLFNAKET